MNHQADFTLTAAVGNLGAVRIAHGHPGHIAAHGLDGIIEVFLPVFHRPGQPLLLQLRLSHKAYEVHILARLRVAIANAAGVCLGIFQVVAADHPTLGVQNLIAVIRIEPIEPVRGAIHFVGLRPEHLGRAAAQNLPGIFQSHLVGVTCRIVIRPLSQTFVHGFVVKIPFGQANNSRQSAAGTQQAQGAQPDGNKLEHSMTFHRTVASIL